MKFQSLTPIIDRNNRFSEKIIGEYELMRAEFEPEELLHLVSTAPDIYYNEGGVTNLITDNRSITNRNINLDVVNNMINRILLSGTVKPTYRDIVYIENVLRKIGITDVKQFLSQVNMLEKEDIATTKLIELYSESVDELRTVTMMAEEERKKEKKGKKKKEEKSQKETEPALYNEIFKRLDTAVIYSELYNIYNSAGTDGGVVRPEQFESADEEKFARNVLLSTYRNYVRNEQVPLTYRNYNVYEEGNTEGDVSSRTSVTNMISSAVLLNHIDKAFRLYSNRIRQGNNEWFDFSKTFFGAGKDTFERIRERAFKGDNVYIYDRNLLELSNEQKTSEAALLTQLVHYVREEEISEGSTYYTEGDKSFIETAKQIIEKLGDISVRKQTLVTTENVYNRMSIDARKSMESRSGDTYTSHDNTFNSIVSREENGPFYKTEAKTDLHVDARSITDEKVEMTLAKIEEGDTNVEGSSIDQTMIDTDVYKQAIDIVNKQSLESITQLAAQQAQANKQEKKGTIKLDMTGAIKDAENIIAGEPSVLLEHPRETVVYEKNESVFNNETTNNVSEGVKQIIDVVKEYADKGDKSVTSEKNKDISVSESYKIDSRTYNESDVDITHTRVEEGDTDIDGRMYETNIRNTEDIKQAIEIINEQNIERISALSQQMQAQRGISEKERVRLDRSQAMLAAEDILAGKHPLEMEYLRENQTVEKKETVYENAVTNVMSEKTKEIMNVVREYMDNPIETVASGKLRQVEPGLLAARLKYLESNIPSPEEIKNTVETEHNLSETRYFDRGNISVNETDITNTQYDTQNVSLVHKQERSFNEAQEIVEELQKNNSIIRRTKEDVQNIVENVNVKRNTVTDQTQIYTETINSDTVNRLITDRFKEDMDEISEKVYDKIEKMLVSERKRRGF